MPWYRESRIHLACTCDDLTFLIIMILIVCCKQIKHVKQVDDVLLQAPCSSIKTITTQAYILHTVDHNNVLQCFYQQSFVMKIILYLIIRELLGIPKYVVKCVAKNSYLNNHSKSIHYTHSLSIVLFFRNSPQQSLRAALHFRSRKYGSRPLFKRRDTHLLGAYEAQYGCRTPEKSTRKAGLEGGSCAPFLTRKKPDLPAKVYLYCLAYISCIRAAFATRMVCSRR